MNRLEALFTAGTRDDPLEQDQTIRTAIAALRRDGAPEDPRFQEIVGHLSLRSAAFRRLWVRHDVGPLRGGPLSVDVAPFGRLDLSWQPFAVPDRTQTVVTISGEPGSAASAALAALATRGRIRRAQRLPSAGRRDPATPGG